MSKHRNALPQLDGGLFATDGGIETTLIYQEGIDLPHFAAFTLLTTDGGKAVLRRYFERYAAIAADYQLGLVLETPTWRASREWGSRLGYDEAALRKVNRLAVELVRGIGREHETPETPVIVSGNLGPRGDGYVADCRMSARQACAYHAPQVEALTDADVDMVAGFTMNYVEEGIGIANAARINRMPVAIAFTVETDGSLPSGQSLRDALTQCDDETAGYPAYYMINCAHPTHFTHVLADAGSWKERIRGIRANASSLSHAELNEMTLLDCGDPRTLAMEYRMLGELLPGLAVVGGCCGTDHRHVDHICGELSEASVAA